MRKLSITLILAALAAAALFAQAPGPGPDNGSATAPNRRLINEPGSCQIGETYYNMTTNLAKICTVAGVFQQFSMTGNQAQPSTGLNFTMFSTPAIPHDLVVPAVTTNAGTGTTYWDEIFIPTSVTLTGACVLNGTGTTDKRTVALWSAAGVVLANGALAGVTDAGPGTYQCQAFITPVAVTGPQGYFVGFIVNGNTDTFYAYVTSSAPTKYITGTVAGTFATGPAAITPGASFVTADGPLMYVY